MARTTYTDEAEYLTGDEWETDVVEWGHNVTSHINEEGECPRCDDLDAMEAQEDEDDDDDWSDDDDDEEDEEDELMGECTCEQWLKNMDQIVKIALHDNSKEIDPDDEHEWEAIVYGWALGKGHTIEASKKIATHITYHTELC